MAPCELPDLQTKRLEKKDGASLECFCLASGRNSQLPAVRVLPLVLAEGQRDTAKSQTAFFTTRSNRVFQKEAKAHVGNAFVTKRIQRLDPKVVEATHGNRRACLAPGSMQHKGSLFREYSTDPPSCFDPLRPLV